MIESIVVVDLFLERGLVGSVGNWSNEVPAQRCSDGVKSSGRWSQGGQVIDISGSFFLRRPKGFDRGWQFEEKAVSLDLWSPVGGCFKNSHQPEVVWVIDFRLPVHYWNHALFSSLERLARILWALMEIQSPESISNGQESEFNYRYRLSRQWLR